MPGASWPSWFWAMGRNSNLRLTIHCGRPLAPRLAEATRSGNRAGRVQVGGTQGGGEVVAWRNRHLRHIAILYSSGPGAGSLFAGGPARRHPGSRRSSRHEARAVKSPRSTSVPKAMQRTYDAVVALTDAFCRDHLNDEYRDLARAMTAALCRKRPSPLASGQPRTWACSIIYVLGQLNFLSDKASQPHMTMAEVCAAFGVGQSTASAKARAISTRCTQVGWTRPGCYGALLIRTRSCGWLRSMACWRCARHAT